MSRLSTKAGRNFRKQVTNHTCVWIALYPLMRERDDEMVCYGELVSRMKRTKTRKKEMREKLHTLQTAQPRQLKLNSGGLKGAHINRNIVTPINSTMMIME